VRLLFVQYSGDWRKTFIGLNEGDEETYHGQRYVQDFVGDLARTAEQVGMLCCKTATAYDEVLPSGVRVMGGGQADFSWRGALRLIATFNPTHIVTLLPHPSILMWAAVKGRRCLPLLADSFTPRTMRAHVKNWVLATLLNSRAFDVIANHGVNASLSLASIGVKPEKIVPWDWEYDLSPGIHEPKALPEGQARRLIYIGSVSKAKGVTDLIKSLPHFAAAGLDVRASIAGNGDIDEMRSLAQRLGVADRVEFLGLFPHSKVVDLMRSGDLVIVPSRHVYPEGFPLTIYEALTSRTPLIVSDHPMFIGNLVDRESAMFFTAEDPQSLFGAAAAVLSDPGLYSAISTNSLAAWRDLQIPMKWGELVRYWLVDDVHSRAVLARHALSSREYTDRIARLRELSNPVLITAPVH
jgi:glycosyltransferase involved in cell wall biosynthesis